MAAAAVDYSPALRALLDAEPEEAKAAIKALPPRERLKLVHDWSFWGRESQVWRPGDEIHTFYLAGRGWGKTRVGAEAARFVAANPWLAGGRRPRDRYDRKNGEGAVLAIAGRTANDVNETMLYGPSGLMTISPPWFKPRHYPSRKILVWPNGAVARLMSGDTPASFRGPNFGWIWTDELAHWARLKKSLMAMRYTLRHGENPRGVHTTTPIAVDDLLRMIFATDESGMLIPARGDEPALQGYRLKRRVRVVHGSTTDNRANLATDFLLETVGEYDGTEEGEQELHGVILFGAKGAPFKRDWIQRCEPEDVPELLEVLVAIDPTVSDGERTSEDEPCECGLVVGGLGVDGRLYVLEDASGVMSPGQWARKAHDLADKWDADRFVAEENQGGSLIEGALRAARPKGRRRKILLVRATQSKFKRAGLVAPVWEFGKAIHVGNPRRFVRLEFQMCNFDPNKPERSQASDRMDAVVWLALAAIGDGTDSSRLSGLSNVDAWNRIARAMRGRIGGA